MDLWRFRRCYRGERYATHGWESGVVPVVLLNKVDLCDDPETMLAETQASLPGVDVHAVSCERGEEGSGGPAEDALDTFEDIEALAQKCRFQNCRHIADEGCRIQEVLSRGELDPGTARSYRSLAREIEVAAQRERKRDQMRPDADSKRSDRRTGKRGLFEASVEQ